MLAAFLLALFTLTEGVRQGVLTWLLREFVPMEYRGKSLIPRINFALHYLGVALYAVFAYAVGGVTWQTAVAAVLIRVALSDPALNFTRNRVTAVVGSGEVTPLFVLGTSSTTDKVLHAIAKLLRINGSLLSGILRVLALAAVVVLHIILSK